MFVWFFTIDNKETLSVFLFFPLQFPKIFFDKQRYLGEKFLKYRHASKLLQRVFLVNYKLKSTFTKLFARKFQSKGPLIYL